ncbi:MAG: hypothetical protein CMM50_07630 [Rhodospirillaceae bacterium]|nr:hypothetical protein [Rhodospirillaceae bacterium]
MSTPAFAARRGTVSFSDTIQDLSSGAVVAVVTVCYCLSYAALIFAGDLAPALPLGIGAVFAGAGVCAIVVAAMSSLKTAIAGPDAPTMAITSAVAGSIAATYPDAGAPNAVATVMVTIGLATGATGIALCVLGVLKLGRWIRYVPYPVIGGFLAASGWLLSAGAIKVVTGIKVDLDHLAAFAEADKLTHIAAAAVYAAILMFVLNRWRHFLALPTLLVAGGTVAFAIMAALGLDVPQAKLQGWLLDVPSETAMSVPWIDGSLGFVDWNRIFSQSGNLAAIVAVTTIIVLVNATGIEVEGRQDADLNRELRSSGTANIVSGLIGGVISNLSLNRTILNARAGATSRMSGVISGILTLVILFAGTRFAGFIPVPILGGLLLFMGVSLLFNWVIKSRRRLGPGDYLLILAIFLVAVRFGYAAGVLVGVVAASVMFAVTYSRVRVVKHELAGNEFSSTVDRPAEQASELRRHGNRIHILWLQGYVFFGSAYNLLEEIKRRVESRETALGWIVLDFHMVSGLDSSAIYSFVRLRQFAEDHRLTLVLTGLPASVENAMRRQKVLVERDTVVRQFPDLDLALEWCEEALLGSTEPDAESHDPFDNWLASEMGDPAIAQRFMSILEPLDLDPGSSLFKQGDPADALYLIRNGRVSVVMADLDGRQIRLRSMIGRTVVGEMGYYRSQPRTASVVADIPTTAYRLSVDRLRRMESEQPEIAAAFHTMIVRVLADRLSFANTEIAALQR